MWVKGEAKGQTDLQNRATDRNCKWKQNRPLPKWGRESMLHRTEFTRLHATIILHCWQLSKIYSHKNSSLWRLEFFLSLLWYWGLNSEAFYLQNIPSDPLFVCLFVCFETGLTKLPRLVLNLWSSCLSFLSTGIIGLRHHAQLLAS